MFRSASGFGMQHSFVAAQSIHLGPDQGSLKVRVPKHTPQDRMSRLKAKNGKLIRTTLQATMDGNSKDSTWKMRVDELLHKSDDQVDLRGRFN
jgi:hypothetical protein